jgi:hypothetical protein
MSGMWATRNAYKYFEIKSRVKRAERNSKIYRPVLGLRSLWLYKENNKLRD